MKPATLTLRNSGWSTIAGHRPIWLVMKRAGYITKIERLPLDLSQLAPGKSITLTAPLQLAAQAAGSYDLVLYASDPSLRLLFNPLYALLFEYLDPRIAR